MCRPFGVSKAPSAGEGGAGAGGVELRGVAGCRVDRGIVGDPVAIPVVDDDASISPSYLGLWKTPNPF